MSSTSSNCRIMARSPLCARPGAAPLWQPRASTDDQASAGAGSHRRTIRRGALGLLFAGLVLEAGLGFEFGLILDVEEVLFQLLLDRLLVGFILGNDGAGGLGDAEQCRLQL